MWNVKSKMLKYTKTQINNECEHNSHAVLFYAVVSITALLVLACTLRLEPRLGAHPSHAGFGRPIIPGRGMSKASQ